MSQNLISKYFFVLFSIIPISIIVGPSVSLANILIIIFSFLIYIFYINEWSWLKDKKIQLLFALYIYLIFNSFIALDFSNSFYRNFGFIRFIILFAAFNYFFLKFENFNKILIVWSVILIFITLDVYYESINGKNILGYGEGTRIFSFFKDEPIVGGYVNSLYLLSIGFLFEFFDDKKNKIKYIIFLISIFFLVAILMTGERSNAIKALFGFTIFYLFIKNFSLKEKLTLVLIIISIFFIIFINSDFIKSRYHKQFFGNFSKIQIYMDLYRSGIEVFKKYPYFGTGNKNYGFETCYGPKKKENDPLIREETYRPDLHNEYKFNVLKNDLYLCSNHPHQTYFEFLAEHGFIGSIVILSIFFKLIFDLLRKISINRNKLQFASFIYILIVFIPILPSGAFFSDYLLTLFFINFSLLFCVNKNSNLFCKNN